MEHVAIMRKSWGLTQKIITGEKNIESRWYKVKYPPWNSIRPGDVIYFKNSGEPVTIKAEVGKVLQFSDLDAGKVKKILKKYGKDDGIERRRMPEFFEIFKDKKFCILIFLKSPEEVEPFMIHKDNFGVMASWITVKDVDSIKQ